MKFFKILLPVLLCLLPSTGPVFAQNELGVSFDEQGTVTEAVTNTPYGQVRAWF